jgi:2-polyprenyl-6-methoxyphenol hydroxylase-like FAD-dependent oxidoreductase
MFDAIVVGARCAGSPTAMLLAQRGYSVLAVDRATFPSDTLSTHFVTADGTARLGAWGLLDRVVASGCEPCVGIARTMQGVHIPAAPDDPIGIAPRRTVLDKILVDAAREAGAEIREGVTVDSLLIEDGAVVGIRARKGGESFEERAKVVIGADGRESFVARSVAADEYNPGGGTTAGYYTYFKNWPHNGPELHLGGGAAHFLFPTNNGEVCVAIEFLADRFKTFREDVDGNFMADLAAFEPFAAKVAQAERTEKIFGQAPHKSFYRKPYGAGWALVGDAGYYRDPLLGQGINDAFRDADNLSAALADVFSGAKGWDAALGEYEATRNGATQMIYGLTNLLCQDLNPSPEIMQMMAAGPPPQPAAAVG